MGHERHIYIDGAWVEPAAPKPHAVINPATEEKIADVALGGAADIDRAVAAARKAFQPFSRSSRHERIATIERILDAYRSRADDSAAILTREVGMPASLARAQTQMAIVHLTTMLDVLKTFSFESAKGVIKVVKEPVGVCGAITPWNAPISQVICKVIPAIAAGCTSVVKPSEVTPLSTLLLAEVMHDADVPAGVFNLVNGDGAVAGHALASHPDVDMVSVTGSVRGGIAVAHAAADTVKRVQQELGGKSPNIILEDADFEKAVATGVVACFFHTGQTCGAPSRMLVPRAREAETIAIARAAADKMRVGDPNADGVDLGPLVNRAQFDRVQGYIQRGIEQGAELIAGGPGRPPGLNRGYYVRPTVFVRVTPGMAIAREEIFGPVLSILSYDDEEEAIRLANDTEYGLCGYVQSQDPEHAAAVAARLRAGYVSINYPPWTPLAPFGGFKRSGNGRQYAEYGLEEYLEIKAVVRAEPW